MTELLLLLLSRAGNSPFVCVCFLVIFARVQSEEVTCILKYWILSLSHWCPL